MFFHSTILSRIVTGDDTGGLRECWKKEIAVNGVGKYSFFKQLKENPLNFVVEEGHGVYVLRC